MARLCTSWTGLIFCRGYISEEEEEEGGTAHLRGGLRGQGTKCSGLTTTTMMMAAQWGGAKKVLLTLRGREEGILGP